MTTRSLFLSRHTFTLSTGVLLAGVLGLLLAVSMAAVIAGATAKARLAKQYPAPGERIDVGGFKMHLNCYGHGSTTVILEAGLDDSSIFWTRVQPRVSQFARVCAYDRAGLGWSDPSPNERTSQNMVKELHALLTKSRVEPPYVLVGHSFGGALVRLYAHNYPGEVIGMVLVDSVHEDLFNRLPVWRQPIGQKLALYRTLAPLGSLGLLALTPGSIPNRGLPDAELAQFRATAVASGYFETGIAENEAFEKNLEQVGDAHITSLGSLPLVVISSGRWDPQLPGLSDAENLEAWQAWQAMQSELVRLSTRGQQVIAKQSGHFIQLQQPQVVVDSIRRVVIAARP